jgi:hypothetical protein
MREQAQRLQEEVVEVQQQFNELIERMTMAKIALEELENGADHADVKMWSHKRDYDD